ncbi:MAG: addiction module toxin RelE [Gammaproteobacteria bacterium]|jgi:REP element-mobilizing transposase RayT|nr:addiction module toxin RelE [Gammaproteobacteria bacterium]MBT6555564.1 addiction module toxin RelE [Candidatus Neomarinimicrobiota bacterium]MBT3471831.1 addiction module toxin RelE [Gammaproteobacteria bacterium]MBT3966984.1 addiction module toxin RelE [Gammaproteobacteria bacterium]MBT4328434.1 addiction module toxin RelE [Gammaproteobacteria bacterium]
MARPLRIEYPGALYHITSRGDRREDIYLDDEDREAWMEVLATTCERFNWVVHAYCQMSNHYHLLVETVDGNLSQGMRQLNGIYTTRFNRRHKMMGHLFQGRYKSILVQKGDHLLELSRYVVLNPVRAGMVDQLAEWFWSSYPAVTGGRPAPEWLDCDWLLNQFGSTRSDAISGYQQFIAQGRGLSSPLERVEHQLFLGDEYFIAENSAKIGQNENLRELSKAHKRSMAKTLEQYQVEESDRKVAMAKAYLSGGYTMKEIGDHFGVHYMTVSRAVRKFEST